MNNLEQTYQRGEILKAAWLLPPSLEMEGGIYARYSSLCENESYGPMIYDNWEVLTCEIAVGLVYDVAVWSLNDANDRIDLFNATNVNDSQKCGHVRGAFAIFFSGRNPSYPWNNSKSINGFN